MDWSLIPMAAGERRSALVLVVSDYRRSGGAPSLPGAKLDAERIAAALTIVGFSVDVALDLELSAMRTRLAEFARHSAAHDVALIYTTGHGVEVDGAVYLLPGDYPIGERSAALHERALRLETIGAATRAKRVNMVFYGGCRDNPFCSIGRLHPSLTPSFSAHPSPSTVDLRGLYSQPTQPSNPLASINLNKCR